MKLYSKDKAAVINRFAWVLMIVSMGISMSVLAQNTRPLDRKISLNVPNTSPQKVLEIIAEQGEFNFSYNPDILKGLPNIGGKFENIAVKDVLEIAFKGKLDYKERDNYVILTLRLSAPEKKGSPTAMLILKGQILDAKTLSPLSEVSVYDRGTLSAAVSDKNGKFKLRIDKPEAISEIALVKRTYQDTILYIGNSTQEDLQIYLNPEQSEVKSVAILYDEPLPIDSIVDENLSASIAEDGPILPKEEMDFQIPFLPPSKTQQGINQRNIKDDIYRTYQFSLLPYVGTNGTLSGNVINDYSFNLFGGISKGTAIAEFGAFGNIDIEDVKIVQMAGWFNLVGRDVLGIQGAGFFNIVGRNVTGVQMAGLFNINGGALDGVQASGIFNANNGSVRGAQLSGLINLALDTVKGIQAAGLLNINARKVTAFQGAGLMNINGQGGGSAQFAGLMNINGGHSDGAQFAGLMNVNAGRVKGAQFSGLMNVAGKVKGSQIGFVNLADSVGGIQLGFFSFSKRGYHKIELFADEIFYTNIAFRTGGNHGFYNIFTAGLNPTYQSVDDLYWTVGYGIGTSPKLSKRLYLNFDLTANQLSKGNFLTAQNNLVKFYTGFEVKLAKRLSFNAGATLNTLIRDVSYTDYPEIFTDYQPRIIYQDVINVDELKLRHPMVQMWIGFKAGIRFL